MEFPEDKEWSILMRHIGLGRGEAVRLHPETLREGARRGEVTK